MAKDERYCRAQLRPHEEGVGHVRHRSPAGRLAAVHLRGGRQSLGGVLMRRTQRDETRTTPEQQAADRATYLAAQARGYRVPAACDCRTCSAAGLAVIARLLAERPAPNRKAVPHADAA